jgi:hypothetical protein
MPTVGADLQTWLRPTQVYAMRGATESAADLPRLTVMFSAGVAVALGAAR